MQCISTYDRSISVKKTSRSNPIANLSPLEPPCTQCRKAPQLCICDSIIQIDTRLKILILQHPQEQNEALSTARLLHLALPNSRLQIGLSWPNLRKAWSRETPPPELHPSRWGVLVPAKKVKQTKPLKASHASVALPDAASLRDADLLKASLPENLEGLVVLDGNWKQAKTLWWRNSWLNRLHKIHLHPERRSLYGKLRRAPRADFLSTLEAVALALKEHDPNPLAQPLLHAQFEAQLQKINAARAAVIADQENSAHSVQVTH